MALSTLLALLAAAALPAAGSPLPASTPAHWSDQAWDAIIVGAGPAGIIVADRLSEAGKKTLLLEQGGSSYAITGGTASPAWLAPSNLSRVDVPGLYSAIFTSPGDLTCGDRLGAFGGCTIGGGSAINAGLFFQPPASDFDDFFPAGWRAADVQCAIEKVKARQPATDVPSANGQLYHEDTFSAMRRWLVDGAGYRDVAINAAANDKTKVFGRPIFDYMAGERGGPVRTYLQTAQARPNFHLAAHVQAQHIARRGGTATGVVVRLDGYTKTIALAPNGRVVLSGGALFSPQLLMLSGIGAPAALARVHAAGRTGGPATWINNTAVGAGLFDNPNTFLELSGAGVRAYNYSYADPPANARSLYLQARSGPYASASEVAVFWDSVARADGSAAGMQGTVSVTGYADYTGPETVTLNIYGTSGLRSTGAVELDADFVPAPSAATYYSDPQDAADIATFMRRILATLPAALTPRNIARDATHDDIVRYITTPSAYARGQVNHFSSSCRIGACVDASARVHGTANVHVVDASILAPLTVNPQMGVMIAAERASEAILRL